MSMAQRLAKIELMRRRQQGTGTFAYNMALYQAIVLDVIQMTLPMLGWSNKLIEIASFRFTLDKAEGAGGKQVTLLGTQIDLQETDPSVYDWGIAEELSPEGYQQAAMPPTSERPAGPDLVRPDTSYTVGHRKIMAVINLNDKLPAAPAGVTNIKWQADTGVAPRNVSAYMPL